VPEIDTVAEGRALPGARAAVLARLWGALWREPVPGVTTRQAEGATLTLTFTDGIVLTGAAAPAQPFAEPDPSFTVTLAHPAAGPAHAGRAATGHRRVGDPGELVRSLAGALGPHATRLAVEVDNSVANLALARAGQPQPDGGPTMLARAAASDDPLAFLEQSVVDGHPLHPCARTRIGLSRDEVLAYAPEHRPVVNLRKVTVPPSQWFGALPAALWLHPWQHERLRHEIDWLGDVEREMPARPLMSLRTFAVLGAPGRHIKTALEVQMTSAVRTVSPASIHNGLQLSALLQRLSQTMPTPDVLPETGGGAAIVDGEPDRRLGVVHRQVPELEPGGLQLPLAALTAPSAATGAPLVTELVDQGYGGDPAAFVEALASMLLPAVIAPLTAGVALEAHGQNLLGVVRDARVTRLRYRDFGGVRVSPRLLRRHGIEPPALRGDVPCDDPEVLRTKVLASAVSTVLAGTVATLTRASGLDETKAWDRVATVARTVPGADEAGLFASTLPLKAMTAMRLADDPLTDQWCTVPNPMAGLR
jgi:siderophore synthetase component